VPVYLNPVLITGQASTAAGAYTNLPAFSTGATNTNMTLAATTGIVSGTPGQFSAGNTPAHTITIANAASGGPAGTFAFNIVANSAFFTYNADGGKGVTLPNIYYFVQGQPLTVASGNYPGYTNAHLSPVGGTGVVSYSIYSATASTPAFSTTGLTFNNTTGAISGTPTTSTYIFNYGFWDYVVAGKKADGSFTLYKIRIKIYRTTPEWSL
jgi:hypothetical protein